MKVERNRIVGAVPGAYNACRAADLGSAFGRTIGSGNVVVTGRDGKGFSRLMKRALTCGVMENGIQVLDTRLVPGPVMRYCIIESHSDYGAYLGFYWRDQTRLATTFFDRKGAIIDEGMVHAILDNEGGDGPGVSAREVGDIIFYAEAKEHYAAELLRSVDRSVIGESQPKILLDCSNGAVSVTLPGILRDLGCRVVSSHDDPAAYMTHKPTMADESLLGEFAAGVVEEEAQLGIALDPCGESARFVDDTGRPILLEELGLVMVRSGGAKRLLLDDSVLASEERFRRIGAAVEPLSPEHNRMMPPGVDLALADDHSCYLGDDIRRWWDAVPLCLRLVEIISKGQVLSELLEALR